MLWRPGGLPGMASGQASARCCGSLYAYRDLVDDRASPLPKTRRANQTRSPL